MHRDIVIEKFGPASTLVTRQIAPRAPGDDEVSIDVAYSGVNFADVQMRIGLYPDAPKKPFVPGYEVSGRISAIGKNVKHVAVGDAVIAGTYFGGYASTVTIPAHQAFKLPEKMDLAAGAKPHPPRETRFVDANKPLYALEADDFAAAVQDGRPPALSEADTIGNMTVLDEMRRQIGLAW
jgi:D-arabinose 1-dehydrogenase-like Zn-dependent alcohol dehydrogenase